MNLKIPEILASHQTPVDFLKVAHRLSNVSIDCLKFCMDDYLVLWICQAAASCIPCVVIMPMEGTVATAPL